jgi:hypothetical protein
MLIIIRLLFKKQVLIAEKKIESQAKEVIQEVNQDTKEVFQSIKESFDLKEPINQKESKDPSTFRYSEFYKRKYGLK